MSEIPKGGTAAMARRMTHIIPLAFDDHLVRVVMRSGEPLWVARDVCAVLGISTSQDAYARIPDDEKGVVQIDTIGGEQELVLLSEQGLSRLIFRSYNPEAERFRVWVFREVLPSIRRTGVYVHPAVDADEDEPAGEAFDRPSRDLNVSLRQVEVAERLYGRSAARALWARLGLPVVGEMGAALAAADGETPDARLVDWMGARTVADPHAHIGSGVLYADYLAWSVSAGVPALSARGFGLALRRSGVRKRRSNGIVYAGLRLRQSEGEAAQ